MAKGDKVGIYDQKQFSIKQELPAPASVEGAEVLYITVSADESKIGVAMGLTLIKEEKLVSDIVVYKLNDNGLFEIECRRPFEFSFSSPHFCFDRYNSN